ncbi:MAG: cation:dicarboxylase symporter family transporter [Rhodospirillales bacterium]|nr:cation:dicarboxylase symporter family transporter [Rhodospirillales bacterium]MCB9996749.1 cation:dicarboxylase symporter family transporter [Rhodospirillales bacterium]
MRGVSSLRSGSDLDKRILNRQILDALVNGNDGQKQIVSSVLQKSANDNRFRAIRKGKASLSLKDIVRVLEALDDAGMGIDTSKISRQTPLAQKAFYDALRESEGGEAILKQLQDLRDEVKTERGFLKTMFNIWAAEKPLEKIAEDVAEFELFCQENKISFNEAEQQLMLKRSKWDKIRGHKFLIAAVGGTAAGLAGMDTSLYPVLGKMPGFFFTALPYFAVPFIGLNVFKAFSQRKLSEEAGTFVRFAGLMAMGVSIGFAAAGIMGDSLGTLEVGSTVESAKDAAAQMLNGGALLEGIDHLMNDMIGWAGQYSPGKILLPVIGGAFGLSFLYKAARDKGQDMKNGLVSRFSKASVAGGNAVSKFTDYFDKGFMGFINTAGVPAIFSLLSMTLAQGGFEKFSQYSGYYATVGLAMAGCAAAIAGMTYAYGHRGAGFKKLAHTFSTAFSLSSSSATMPVTKKALEGMGVREKVRNAVVPLGATFNMMGTSLYLGMTAVCASMMLGNDPGFTEQLGVMATAIGTAFGAPGIPASSIAFMTPVLQTLEMSPEQMSAVFAMILLMDRPFDMLQTGLNVTGDMVVSMDTEASARGGGSQKLLSRAFNKIGLKKLGAKLEVYEDMKPQQDDKPAPASPPAPR